MQTFHTIKDLEVRFGSPDHVEQENKWVVLYYAAIPGVKSAIRLKIQSF